ncbi:B3 DNA binding domain containing protein [Trema orientale]|uniref:B3 DNA binding domain containing protein n=1 Tax=Trema orientale TaxID=63057 RepID=A0A2P5EBM1_TREOI|nr:B3 DNA binding domain containing protein [Trema orientale]
MENNNEKEFLFQKAMKKTDEKNNFLRLKKDDAEKYFGPLGEGETKQINFKDNFGNLRTIDYSHRKIDKSSAYVLSGENWKLYVSHIGLKKDDTVKFYGHRGDCNLFFIEDSTLSRSLSIVSRKYLFFSSLQSFDLLLRISVKGSDLHLGLAQTRQKFNPGGLSREPHSMIFFVSLMEAATTLRSPSVCSVTGVSWQPENTVVHSSVNPSIQAPYYTESGSVRGATRTTPTNSPGAFSNRSDNAFAENPSTSRLSQFPSAPVPGSIPGDQIPTFSLPPADQTGIPNSHFDYLNIQGIIDPFGDQQLNLQSAFSSAVLPNPIGQLPNVDDDSQPLTNNDKVGRNNQSYFDQYINKYGQGLLNQLDSAQNEHVKPFVLNSVGSIMKILATNHIGQVDSNDLRSQVDTYWEPITQFNLDLSPLNKLVDESLANLHEFEQTKKQVDDHSKTLEAIEIEIESAERRLEEFRKQAMEIKNRIEEGKNCMATMRVSPLQSRF